MASAAWTGGPITIATLHGVESIAAPGSYYGDVSVTANVAPRLMHELCKAAIAGDVARAMEIQMKLLPVHKTLFIESNPIPVKWAVSRMGLSKPALRLPLTPLTEASQPALEKAMQTAGLI